ncbi:MAG TPA: hypothetical protein DEP04_02285 [Dehalococcoidia bacterium]|nr:hypothetical protein [Dehalococcoidia bacterium]|tara:strand:+ start:440 stop:811 length:372 start_codon:yes stop_codon:yes gene_type:complete
MTNQEQSPDKQQDNRESSSSEQQEDGRGKSAGTKDNMEQYQWVKGQSGNSSGRPVKNTEFIKALKEYGEHKPLTELSRPFNTVAAENNRDALVERVWKDATGGDYKAIKLLLDLDVIKPNDSD